MIDIYGSYLHVAEYERPTPHSEEEHKEWQEAMLDAATRALTISRERLFFKYREKPDDGLQYGKVDAKSHMITVREAGLSFLVNLSDYIDTGLFLDHRPARAMIRDISQGKSVLNLYSYTGSFTVYAVAGGASSTVSVDLSQTYSEWAKENLKLNGFFGPEHSIITEDVTRFLEKARREKRRFDIVILDPPTFSNSKKMARVLDIQRDHGDLINACLNVVRHDGMVFFSTNFKRIKFDAEKIRASHIEEITERTIPEDFKGKRPHRAWLIQRDGANNANKGK